MGFSFMLLFFFIILLINLDTILICLYFTPKPILTIEKVMKKFLLFIVSFLCMNTMFAQSFYKAEFTDANKEGVYIVEVNFGTKRITLYQKEGNTFLFYSVFDKLMLNQNNIICAKYSVYDNMYPPIEERDKQLYFIVSDTKIECNNIKKLDDHFNLIPVDQESYRYFTKNLVSEIMGTSVSEGGTGGGSNGTATTTASYANNTDTGKPLGNDINSTSGTTRPSSTQDATTRPSSTIVAGYALPHADLVKLVENGDKEAQKELIKRAEDGNAEAQFYLGKSYYTEGADKESDKQAFKWFEKAAKQDNADAQLYLGECYFYGYGVTPNYELAVAFYTKSATLGYAEAMFSLAWCYENGYGVNRSLSEAKKWYRRAKEKGSANAIQRLKDLGE